MEKVKVTSMTSGPVSVKVPQLMFQREWSDKGAAVMIDKSVLAELMYDIGFKYMIDKGMLYIEDFKVKQELGLEPEDAAEPVNIIVLSDSEKKDMLTTMKLKDFKAKAKALNREQLDSLIDYAIANRYADLDKVNTLRTLTGRDIIQTIRLSEANKEQED